jgi:hypothetical protein
VDDARVAEHLDLHVLIREGHDVVAAACRGEPLVAGHRLGMEVDRREAEAVGDQPLEPVHVALLGCAHPVVLQDVQLLAVALR